MPTEYKNSIVFDLLFKPVFDLYQRSEKRYQCREISDLDFLKLGITRVLKQSVSGQDFIQEMGDKNLFHTSISLFFKALRSKRRLANINSINDLLLAPIQQKIKDPFAPFPELKNWEIYAVDGHYQKAACHDPIYITSKGQHTHAATGHFFRLNLRNHHMSLLNTSKCHLTTGKKNQHDMTIIKEATTEELRYDASREQFKQNHLPDAPKPNIMLVWDRACIDYQEWYKRSHEGVYFVTIEKANSVLTNCSNDLCDHSDPRNEGVVSEHLVGNGNGAVMRRIHYINPMDQKSYSFITNELELPAYLIVAFYKHRWDIEKIYYQFKTKFSERKSWATSTPAKMAHAIFICLLHNLSLLTEAHVRDEDGLIDEVAIKQLEQRKRAPEKGHINQIVQRATHRSFRLIRWLRNLIHSNIDYETAIERLRTLYTQTL